MPYWSEDPSGVLLVFHVLPNAPRTQIVGLHGEALKLKVHAPPVDGKANDEIVAFLSEASGLAKSRIRIVSGELGKSKRVKFEGIGWDELKRRMKLP